jgi:hypothetical protein
MDGDVMTQLNGASQAILLFISQYTAVRLVLVIVYTYRVSKEECAILREGVRYVKLYRKNPKHLYPKLNGYGDKGQRKVW